MSDSPAKTPAEISPQEVRLASELEELRKQMEALKHPDRPKRSKSVAWIPWIGGILGILTTVIAFPKAWQEAVQTIFVKPQSSVEAKEMVISYDQKMKYFHLNFPLYIQNAGNADDVLTPTGRIYYSPSSSSDDIMKSFTQSFDAGLGEFDLYDKGMPESLTSTDEVPPPIQVSKQSEKMVLLSVRFDTGSFETAGWNLLDVELNSDHGKHPHLLYCFYLDDKQIAEIKDRNTDGHQRFLGSECGG